MQIGILTQKMARQLGLLTIIPPNTGPRIGPSKPGIADDGHDPPEIASAGNLHELRLQ